MHGHGLFKQEGSFTFMFVPRILNNKCLLYTNMCTNSTFTPHHTPHTHTLHHTTHTPQHTHPHTHTHTPNQELHMQPHLPTFYHNNTLQYCILSF